MSEKDFEAQLTLKDRLNFPYLLANQILTFQKAILNLEFSEREIRESIEGFIHLIPDDWKDDEFQKEMNATKIKQKKDMRPQITGTVRMSEKACRELGIPAFVEEEVLDYYKIFQACINLLKRKGLISQVITTDKATGERYDS